MSSNQMKLLLAAATAAVPFILHGCKGDEATTSNVAEGCLEIQCAGKSFECDDKGSCKYKGDANAKVEDVCKYEVKRHPSSAWTVSPTAAALEGDDALPEIEKLYVKGNCIFAVMNKDATVAALTVEQKMLIGYAGKAETPAKSLTVNTGSIKDEKNFFAVSQATLTTGTEDNSNFKVTGNFKPKEGPIILTISTDGKLVKTVKDNAEEAAPADATNLFELVKAKLGVSQVATSATAKPKTGSRNSGQISTNV